MTPSRRPAHTPGDVLPHRSGLLALVEELVDLARAQGHLQARIEFAIHVAEALPADAPPSPDTPGPARRDRQSVTHAIREAVPTTGAIALRVIVARVCTELPGTTAAEVRQRTAVLARRGDLARVGAGLYTRVNGHTPREVAV